jgi:Cu+-exporting ATPase
METVLQVDGMSCGKCAERVAKGLTALPGVSAEVSHEAGTARVQHPEEIPVEELVAAVRNAGYEAHHPG